MWMPGRRMTLIRLTLIRLTPIRGPTMRAALTWPPGAWKPLAVASVVGESIARPNVAAAARASKVDLRDMTFSSGEGVVVYLPSRIGRQAHEKGSGRNAQA